MDVRACCYSGRRDSPKPPSSPLAIPLSLHRHLVDTLFYRSMVLFQRVVHSERFWLMVSQSTLSRLSTFSWP